MRCFLYSLVVILVAGCAAGGPRFEESNFVRNPNLTEIYIFRLSKFVDGGGCYEVGVNGLPIGVLANGGFLRKEVSPGSSTVSIPMPYKPPLNVDFKASSGETLFFQFNVALNDQDAIPKSEVISTRAEYSWSKGELMNFHNLLVQVKESYALDKLKLLRDSSIKVSCMATVRIES